MPLGAFRLNSIARYLVPAGGSFTELEAVELNSGEYYYYTSGLSSTASKSFTFSCWFNVQQKSPRSVPMGMRLGDRLLAGPFVYNNTVDATGRFYSQTPSATFDRTSTENGLYETNVWTHFAVSVNQNTPVIQMYINGRPLTVSAITNIENFSWNNITGLWINGYDNGNNTNNIKVSQLWFDNNFVDLSTNIDKFYDDGPVDLGSDGTGTGLGQPLIYHYGDTSTFAQNRGSLNYTLSVSGTPADTQGPVVLNWSTWDGTLDGSQQSNFVGSVSTALVSVDDSYGLIARRTGDGPSQLRIATKSGNSLSLYGSTWTSLGAYNEDNNGNSGKLILSPDKTYGYYLSYGGIARINSITSTGFSVSNRVANTIFDEFRDAKITASGTIVVLKNNARHVVTVTGTSSISISVSTVTYTGITSGNVRSVAFVSDNQHVLIEASTTSQKAWLCGTTTTPTQIGSSYTDSITVIESKGKMFTNELNHGYCVFFGRSGNNHTYYMATNNSFSKFTVTGPFSNTNIYGTYDNAGYISLDSRRFMVTFTQSNNFTIRSWIVDRIDQSIQSYNRSGEGWEENTRVNARPWGTNSVILLNNTSLRVLTIE
jgi:hypothetical protein